ncbi:MAG TPA: RNA polymerase sigma factor [Polyangia bacterium]|jgi:RNA polymerase sigma-70 factor (ECF subfamily)|nr:RNA polymerase sigma factor [Polyangia bacterium]
MAPDAEGPAWSGNEEANEAMSRYADGEAAAFPILYDAIAPRIEGFIRRRTRDASRVDDLLQQTFERIHRARGTFIRGSDVLAWAFTIARNLCLDLGAKGWRERGVDGGGDADPIASAVAEIVDAERIATARESLARLVDAFRQLPERQQAALELVRVEGFTMAAAAATLGVTVPSIKMAVFRGAAALREAVLAGGDAPRGRADDAPSAAAREDLRGVT